MSALPQVGWWEGYFTLTTRHLPWYAVLIASVQLSVAVFVPAVRTSALVQLAVVELLALAVWLLLRAGRSGVASAVAVAGGWLLLAGASLLTGGVGPVHLVTFTVLVVLAALLLGSGGAVTIAVLTMALVVVAPAGPGGASTWLPALAPSSPGMVRVALAYLFIIIFLAVAQREMREAVLRNASSLSLLRATLDSTADGILVVDTMGAVAGHNQKFLDLWGIPAEMADARDDRKMIAYVLDQLKDPGSFTRKIGQLYDQPDAVSSDLLEFHDGRRYERYSQPQKLDGKTVGRVWSFRDVTERHHAEAARRRLEAELFQAQKMEALGRLAGGIAHDFNNILTAIVSYTELARLDSEDRPAAQESHDEVIRASHRARDLIKQILVFSRSKSEGRIPIRLGAIVTETLGQLQASLPEGVQVVVEPFGDDRVVLADPTQIHQVVMNLCVNAGHAMGGAGGRMAVGLEHATVAEEPVPAVPGLPPGAYMVLKVTDTGPGMDQATLARIYEPFFSTKAAGKGTGLGLAVVHSIVRNHEGGIAAESVPGRGTTFRVYFPVWNGSPAEAAAGSDKPA
jgi:PAS domain S-box-containing protein